MARTTAGHVTQLALASALTLGAQCASVLIIALIVTGVAIWDQYFYDWTTIPQKRVAVLLHSLAAIALICIWIAHVYAAFWARGTLRAMTRGSVTGGWAWRHHRLWLKELAERHRIKKPAAPAE